MKLNQVWLYSSYRFQIKGLEGGRQRGGVTLVLLGLALQNFWGFFWLQETEPFLE